ncbi:MAG TPA: FtsX-like permease family protein, partial [Blastocatellia bacterium]|nr:FtsX-like permease family protein [Blastocatellia bacterium]
EDVSFNLGARSGPVVYRPLAQHPSQSITLIVHTKGDPKAQIAAMRGIVQAIDDDLPAQEIKTLEEIVGLQFWPARMLAGLLAALGSAGLILASIGVYGVMSYAVAQRTREIGVRMALGARSRDVLNLVVGQGMGLTLAGAAIGLALSAAATRYLSSLLYGVGATDPATFAGVASFLICVALLACYLPARSATKVDPLAALRRD